METDKTVAEMRSLTVENNKKGVALQNSSASGTHGLIVQSLRARKRNSVVVC